MELLFSFILMLIIVVGPIYLIFYIRQKNRRCRYCLVGTKKVQSLPELEEINRLIENEKMPGTAARYELCSKCKRLYDWRWFDDERVHRRDGDMRDRQCVCGFDLRPLWGIKPEISKEALRAIPPETLNSLYEKYGKSRLIEKLYDPLDDDNILFLCSQCRRIYMWQAVDGYQVLQCISQDHSKYDPDPFVSRSTP